MARICARRASAESAATGALHKGLTYRGAGGAAFGYNLPMDPLVLTVDMAGLPQAWVELEEAITYHAKQTVAWSLGEVVREFRGGWQRDGSRSRLSTKSILAIKGSAGRPLSHTPGLTNPMLFARDRQVCAYCGGRFLYRDLSRDHIIPASRGGRDTWMNSVTACRPCNTRKGNRFPEEIGMHPLTHPVEPHFVHLSWAVRRLTPTQARYIKTFYGSEVLHHLEQLEHRGARAAH